MRFMHGLVAKISDKAETLEEIQMKIFKSAALAVTFVMATAAGAYAACDPGETVIKFSHVTNTDKHPKGIAASLLAERVNNEMNGKACMEVFPNSTLYDDNKVLEALLNGDVHMAAPSLSKFEKFTKIPDFRPAFHVPKHRCG